MLIGFVGEQVEIQGVINLETTVGTGSTVKVEKIRFMMVNASKSYNVILGRPAFNRLRVIVSTVLSENWDAFPWSSTDMPNIDLDFLCLHLSIAPGICPISQKKRRLGEEKRRMAKAEIARLLQAGFIQEVKYPILLSNVVIVKKPSGKWRMCIDYTNLNKTCPKDCIPYLASMPWWMGRQALAFSVSWTHTQATIRYRCTSAMNPRSHS
ncbi:hypothetical protein CR513_41962, partial [Mucuna pruriens]